MKKGYCIIWAIVMVSIPIKGLAQEEDPCVVNFGGSDSLYPELRDFCFYLKDGIEFIGPGYSNLYMKEDMGVNEPFRDIINRFASPMKQAYRNEDIQAFAQALNGLVFNFHDSHMVVMSPEYQVPHAGVGFDAEFAPDDEGRPVLVVKASAFCPLSNFGAVHNGKLFSWYFASYLALLNGMYNNVWLFGDTLLCPGAKITHIDYIEPRILASLEETVDFYEFCESVDARTAEQFAVDEAVPLSHVNFGDIDNAYDKNAFLNLAMRKVRSISSISPLYQAEGAVYPRTYIVKYNYKGYGKLCNKDHINEYGFSCDSKELNKNRCFITRPLPVLGKYSYEDVMGVTSFLGAGQEEAAFFKVFNNTGDPLLNGIGYLRLRSAHSGWDLNALDIKEQHINAYESMAKEYEQGTFNRLVVDLRDHNGGSPKYFYPLYYFLFGEGAAIHHRWATTSNFYNWYQDYWASIVKENVAEDSWRVWVPSTIRVWLPSGGWMPSEEGQWVEIGHRPAEPFTGKVAFLTDEYCASAGEWPVSVAWNQEVRSGIKVFGSRTMGITGGPESLNFSFPGARDWSVRIPKMIGYWAKEGHKIFRNKWFQNPENFGMETMPLYLPVEGLGIPPEVTVDAPLKDLLRGTAFNKRQYERTYDEVVFRALTWLKEFDPWTDWDFADGLLDYPPQWIKPDTRKKPEFVSFPFEARMTPGFTDFDLFVGDDVEISNILLSYEGIGTLGGHKYLLGFDIYTPAGTETGPRTLYMKMDNYEFTAPGAIVLAAGDNVSGDDFESYGHDGDSWKDIRNALESAGWQEENRRWLPDFILDYPSRKCLTTNNQWYSWAKLAGNKQNLWSCTRSKMTGPDVDITAFGPDGKFVVEMKYKRNMKGRFCTKHEVDIYIVEDGVERKVTTLGSGEDSAWNTLRFEAQAEETLAMKFVNKIKSRDRWLLLDQIDIYSVPRCYVDEDCENPDYPICNAEKGVCVECILDRDCTSSDNSYCDYNRNICLPF